MLGRIEKRCFLRTGDSTIFWDFMEDLVIIGRTKTVLAMMIKYVDMTCLRPTGPGKETDEITENRLYCTSVLLILRTIISKSAEILLNLNNRSNSYMFS